MAYQNRPPLDDILILVYERMRHWPSESVAQSVDAVMADEIKVLSADRQEALRKEAEVLERLAVVYRTLAGGDVPLANPAKSPVSAAALARLPLEDAIIAFLRQAKVPKKVSQICRALVEAGHQFSSGHPPTAVKTAVRRLATSNLDLVYVGSGKWTLESIHRPAQLKKLREKNGGRGGHSTEEHAKRTRDGMIAKGLKFGRKPKFGADDIAKFRHLVDNKIMRPIAALKEVGISTPYYYGYKNEIYAWKAGDPWPPGKDEETQPSSATPDELRARGIIPLHARVVGEKE
jgi:hypothetical protein